MSEEIKIRPANLPPLAKDLVAVVSAYKKIKRLGPDWEAKHMARGMIYAGELLTAVGVQGGQVERAVGLLEWLKESGKDFDLGSAPSFFKQYESHLAAKNNVKKCIECIRPALPDALICKEHSWCYKCDDAGKPSEKKPEELVLEKPFGRAICRGHN